MKKKTGRLVCEEYCRKFPDTPDLTLAKKVYKENNKLFTTLENCRNTIRVIRGHNGNTTRKETKDKSAIKK